MSAKGLRIGAAVALVGGLAAGGVLLALSGRAMEQTVAGFARAPVGCTTTLQFDTADTFTFFVETKGEANDVGGDCSGNGLVYDRGDDDPPKVTLALVDANGGQVPLTPSSAYSYDTSRFVGAAVESAEVTAGTYRLTVVSDSKDFAIAVGRDPEVDSSVLQAAAGAVALLGLVVGVVLVGVSLRKHPAPPAAEPPPWNAQSAVEWAMYQAPAPVPPPAPEPTVAPGATPGQWAPPPPPPPGGMPPPPSPPS